MQVNIKDGVRTVKATQAEQNTVKKCLAVVKDATAAGIVTGDLIECLEGFLNDIETQVQRPNKGGNDQ